MTEKGNSSGKGANAAAVTSRSKPWLAEYSAIVPKEMPPLEFSSIGDLLTDASRKFTSRPAFTCMDKTLSYRDLEAKSAALGAYLQSKGLGQGRARRHHDAERAAISRRHDGHPARRLYGGQCQPALHAART